MASYRSLGAAADAAARLPTRAEWDEIEVIELIGPEPSFSAGTDPEGPAGITPRRVGVGAGLGAAVGGALGLLVGLLADIGAPFLVGAIVMGAVFAGIVGFAVSGVARYGGAHAEEQTPAPTLGSVALLTVWTPDDGVANVVAHALGTADTIDIRVVDDEGHWHAPNGD